MADEVKLYTVVLDPEDGDSYYNVRATPKEMKALRREIAEHYGVGVESVEYFGTPVLTPDELRAELKHHNPVPRT